MEAVMPALWFYSNQTGARGFLNHILPRIRPAEKLPVQLSERVTLLK